MDFVIEGFSYHPTIQRLHPTVKGLEEYRVRLPNRPRRKKSTTTMIMTLNTTMRKPAAEET